MPPLLPPLASASATIRSRSAGATRWPAQPLPVTAAAAVVVAGFSTTTSRPKFTKARRDFRAWEKGPGAAYRRHTTPGPVYLTKHGNNENTKNPFPMNRHFQSTMVLNDRSREIIWERVMRHGHAIKAVSAEFGVDIRRVAAVVRLKEVEKDWIAKGKPLATPYADAVMSMLPTHTLKPALVTEPFEPINELHVHPFTMQQLFWPTSESRHFTREDAALAFHPKLLSADKRVPHPELVQMEREVLQGQTLYEASERFKLNVMESERKAAEKQVARAAYEEKKTTRHNTERFEFRFKDYNSEDVGVKGRSRGAVGWRYGNPHDDRSKGQQIKIPTSVP